MKVIYQIGRLDANMKPLKFSYSEQINEDNLSSFILKKHLGHYAKVILIFPVSLPFNKAFIKSIQGNYSTLGNEFIEEVRKVLNNKENYLKNPYEFFKKHPHVINSDGFEVIHSIGKYGINDEIVDFDTCYGDIVLEILFDMIERHFENEIEELYIDISTGLNVYVSALLEAARHFYVFSKLQNLGNISRKLKMYKVFSEPVVDSVDLPYEVFTEEIKYKIFFESPIKKEDIKEGFLLKKVLGDEDNLLSNKIDRVLKNFLIHFSALKNATPLANYEFEIDNNDDVEELIKKFVKLKKSELKSNWEKTSVLPKDEILKTILSMSFYMGIIKILNKIKKSYRADEGICIKNIRKNFGATANSIYKKIGLYINIIFIENETNENREKKYKDLLKEYLEKNNKSENEWIKLKELHNFNPKNFSKRNFFAHAGFESNCTLIKEFNGRIYFKYSEDKKIKIKEALIDAL